VQKDVASQEVGLKLNPPDKSHSDSDSADTHHPPVNFFSQHTTAEKNPVPNKINARKIKIIFFLIFLCIPP
jgi:hypothetical protein